MRYPTVDIAGLFNNAAGCFEHVQLDHSFDTDGRCSLRLDLARLRLSRWGKAAGLSNNLEDTQLLQDRNCMEKATRALNEILELFKTTKELSAKYERSVKLDTYKPALTDVHTNGDPSVQSLHKKIRQLSIEKVRLIHTKRQGQVEYI
jgi:tRNA U34 5-carboxymethylaminomethyl modifying enzyme MnmG/GidA